jgi:anti-sigma factor RsiW
MDCGRARELVEDELDGALAPIDARALEEHLASCPTCARERALLAEIDAALSEAPIESAPRWLPMAVAREIARESAVERRVEPIAVGVAAAVGVASAAVAIVRAAAPSVAGPLGNAASRVIKGLGSFMESLMTTPGVPTAWSENPGIAGFAWGLAIGLVAFLAVSVYRFSRQPSLEWR